MSLCASKQYFFSSELRQVSPRLLPPTQTSPVGFVALAASNYRLYQSDISPWTSAGRGVEPYRTADSVVAPTSEGEEARREGA